MTSPTPPDDRPVTASPAGPPAEGRVLAGRYRLGSMIASGGMAQVWQGTDEVLRREVAVKLLHPHLAADTTFVARFRQEAVAAARLGHAGIVAIFDTCSEDGVEAIVMELVPGRTLRERLDDPTPIDPWQAAGLTAQVAEALEAAHRSGLVHRDIKPANILLTADGRVKVTDFGIAKAVAEADLTQPGLMVGTAKYVAPEQVRGEAVDARTDIYSLGVVLYEILCGRPPFAADTDAGTALARLQRDPLRPRQVRPGVPRALEEVVCRALSREPDDRYPSAADMRAALLAAGATPAPEPDLTVAARAAGADPAHTVSTPLPWTDPATVPPPPPAPSFTQSERSWMVPTAVVVVLAVALGVASLLLGRSGAGDLFDNVRDALGGGSASASALGIAGAQAFDPDGRDGENDGIVHLAIDGDPATAWRTEGYDDRDITKLKAGVGLIVGTGQAAELVRMEIDSPTNDWSAEVYVAAQPVGELADWGSPVARVDGTPAGETEVDLGDTDGRAVLIWITDRGDAPGRAAAELAEVRLYGR